MNNRTMSAVILGSAIIAIAVGLIVYAVIGGSVTIILWTGALIFGISLIALSFLSSKKSGKFSPSEFTYRFVNGVLMAVFGVIGILYLYADISPWILVALFLIALALVGIVAALVNGKKEEQ